LHVSAGTSGQVFRADQSAESVALAVYGRRNLVSLAFDAAGALALVLVPRRRWPRVPLVAATNAWSGVASMFAGWEVVTIAYNLQILPTPALYLTMDAVAVAFLFLGIVFVVEIVRTRDWAPLVLSLIAALTTLLAFPIVYGSLWGARSAAVVAGLAAIYEAKRWDSILVWEEKLAQLEG
jgi:hypothetical protein